MKFKTLVVVILAAIAISAPTLMENDKLRKGKLLHSEMIEMGL